MLRGSQHEVGDVIQRAMLSLLKNPPTDVKNWEAVLVTAVKRKFHDLWKSAPWQREQLAFDPDVVGLDISSGGDDVTSDHADEVVQRLAQQPDAVRLLGFLKLLDERAAFVSWQVKALDRTVLEVADEMDVSRSRVSQILSKALKDLSG